MSNRLTLVDTSAFVDFSRHAGSSAADAVDTALAQGRAAVCNVVAAELLTGCRSQREYREMELLLSSLAWLPLTDECWARAAALGFNLRRSGLTVPLTDRLVVATARAYEVELLHRDAHFDLLIGVPDAIQ